MTAFRKTERRAAKPHLCTFCEAYIVPGERYIDGFWVSPDYGPSPWKAHPDCQELAEQYPDADAGVPAFRDWETDYDLCDMPEQQAEFERLMIRAEDMRRNPP